MEQFEDLRDFDNGGGGDDGEAEGFGEGEGEAGGGVEGEVEDEGFVAGGAEEGEAEGAEGWGEVVGYGLEVRPEEVHCWVLGFGVVEERDFRGGVVQAEVWAPRLVVPLISPIGVDLDY